LAILTLAGSGTAGPAINISGANIELIFVNRKEICNFFQKK
jgi:hypothetical protein